MRHQQLSLFTRPATAAMRDRTKARNYSPEKEEFRRDHACRRRWGLARRHAQKLCRTHGCSRECAEVGLHDHSEAVPPLIWPDEASCAQRPPTAAPSRGVPIGRAATSAPAGRQSQRTPRPHATPDPATPTEPAGQGEPADQTEPTSHVEPKSPANQATPAQSTGRPQAACRRRSASQHEPSLNAVTHPRSGSPPRNTRSPISISDRTPADRTAANPLATNSRHQPRRRPHRLPPESRTPQQSLQRRPTKTPPAPPSQCRASPAGRGSKKRGRTASCPGGNQLR